MWRVYLRRLLSCTLSLPGFFILPSMAQDHRAHVFGVGQENEIAPDHAKVVVYDKSTKQQALPTLLVKGTSTEGFSLSKGQTYRIVACDDRKVYFPKFLDVTAQDDSGSFDLPLTRAPESSRASFSVVVLDGNKHPLQNQSFEVSWDGNGFPCLIDLDTSDKDGKLTILKVPKVKGFGYVLALPDGTRSRMFDDSNFFLEFTLLPEKTSGLALKLTKSCAADRRDGAAKCQSCRDCPPGVPCYASDATPIRGRFGLCPQLNN